MGGGVIMMTLVWRGHINRPRPFAARFRRGPLPQETGCDTERASLVRIPLIFNSKGRKCVLLRRQKFPILGWGGDRRCEGGAQGKSKFTATVEMEAARLLSALQTLTHWLSSASWPTVKWTERGPLGTAPASTLHVSNSGMCVCVCVGLSTGYTAKLAS